MIPLEEIENEVDGFIRQRFKVAADDPSYDKDADLYENGYVDSLGLAELYIFLGSTFGVEIPDEDVVSDDFLTVAGISRILERLMATSGEASA